SVVGRFEFVADGFEHTNHIVRRLFAQVRQIAILLTEGRDLGVKRFTLRFQICDSTQYALLVCLLHCFCICLVLFFYKSSSSSPYHHPHHTCLVVLRLPSLLTASS